MFCETLDLAVCVIMWGKQSGLYVSQFLSHMFGHVGAAVAFVFAVFACVDQNQFAF